MTYQEIKNAIEGKELSINAEFDFRKLSESSSQRELDRFVRVHSSLFAEKSARQEIIERYIKALGELKTLKRELADVGEGSSADILDGLAGIDGGFDAERNRIEIALEAVSARIDAIEAEARQYAYTDMYGRSHSILEDIE